MQMIRETSPITFFEKISNLIIRAIPNFFYKKFNAEEDSNTFLDKTAKTNLTTKEILGISKVQRKLLINKLSIESDVLKFVIDWNHNEASHLREHVQDGKLKGQSLFNANYIASHTSNHKQGETFFENQLAPLLKSLHSFNLLGKKIFRVEQHLMEELLLTECSKIDDQFLQLPYDTICLHYPFNNQIKIRDSFLEWVFITQHDFEQNDGYSSEFEIFCITRNSIFYNETFKFEGGDIGKQIKDQTSIKYLKSRQAVEENIALFSLITSTLLYLNSESADKVNVMPKCIIEQRHTKYPICSLGRNIVINKDFHNYSNNTDEKNERLIYILKWTVRGHFRRQPCGKDFSEKRTIWIRPYIKGAERYNEELISKPSLYVMNKLPKP